MCACEPEAWNKLKYLVQGIRPVVRNGTQKQHNASCYQFKGAKCARWEHAPAYAPGRGSSGGRCWASTHATLCALPLRRTRKAPVHTWCWSDSECLCRATPAESEWELLHQGRALCLQNMAARQQNADAKVHNRCKTTKAMSRHSTLLRRSVPNAAPSSAQKGHTCGVRCSPLAVPFA